MEAKQLKAITDRLDKMNDLLKKQNRLLERLTQTEPSADDLDPSERKQLEHKGIMEARKRIALGLGS